jgi:hypothetical protein
MEPQHRRIAFEHLRYQRTLGRFFLLWADAELAVYKVLVHYCGVSDAIGRAIFSGCRARVMIDYLKNIIHNTSMEEERASDIEYLTAQMNVINTVRDRIAHYGSAGMGLSVPTMEYSISNWQRVGKLGAGFHTGVSVAHIESMSLDLERIAYRLGLHWRKNAPVRLGEDVPRDGPTWRYTPAPPSSPRSRNPATRQGPKPPPKPSPP